MSGPIIHKKRALEVTGNNCVTRFVIVLMDSGVIPEIQCFGERFEQYRSAIDHHKRSSDWSELTINFK